ncbi:hypothetical protein V6N13_072858 [Hibiscus sabdariffa]|uniref:Uncharacterized protein n=1 Tax=Hibiscus sabdariffa TaxID=183260 RepID=A0ABR2E7C9_9ROSI
MGELTLYDFSQNLVPTKYFFHSDAVNKLKDTCFENLIKPIDVLRHSYPFLQALLQRLPIDGNLVIVDESAINVDLLCIEKLGNKDALINKGSHIVYNWVRYSSYIFYSASTLFAWGCLHLVVQLSLPLDFERPNLLPVQSKAVDNMGMQSKQQEEGIGEHKFTITCGCTILKLLTP